MCGPSTKFSLKQLVDVLKTTKIACHYGGGDWSTLRSQESRTGYYDFDGEKVTRYHWDDSYHGSAQWKSEACSAADQNAIKRQIEDDLRKVFQAEALEAMFVRMVEIKLAPTAIEPTAQDKQISESSFNTSSVLDFCVSEKIT